MFGGLDKFDMSNDPEEGEEIKTFSFTPYEEYLEQKTKDEGKKKQTKKPKEKRNDFLKIIPFETNKSKIKLRKLQEMNILPAHPFRLLLVGRSGSGKSMNLVNLMTRPHMYGRLDPKDPKTHFFDLIFLFSPTAEGGDDLADHLDLPINRIITEEKQFYPVLEHILKTQKDIIERKDLLKSPKICLIFDDCQSAEKFLRSENFTKIFIAGRHYNISVICCGQSWTKFNRVTRLNSSNIMLYPSSGSEVDLLTDEYTPVNSNKKDFKKLVQHATSEPYSFLHINNQVKMKDRYRKNLDTILSINKE